MRYSSFISLAVLAGPSLVAAYPRGRREAAANATSADVTVLRFAEALQHLEDQFYQAGVDKFSASDLTGAGFAGADLVLEQIKGIQSDEQTHAKALGDALGSLGSSTIEGCSFDFGGATADVATLVATARVVENVGVAAFLGAAQLVTDPVLLTAAATILTVEARHQTLLNIFAGSGHTIPQAFDIPLLPNEVLAIAGPFVKGCDLGVGAPLPTLAIKNTDPVLTPGLKLEFDSPEIKNNSLSCQMLAGGMPFSVALPIDNCVIPDAMNGPVAIFITSDEQPLAGNPKDRAQNKIVAGPAMAFVDPNAQALPALVRNRDGVKKASDAAASSDSSKSGDDKSSEGGDVSVSSGGDAGKSSEGGEVSVSSGGDAGKTAESTADAKFAPVNDSAGTWGEIDA